MPHLRDLLLASERREALVADCVALIERHVANRTGLKGAGLKAGLAMFKKARPDILPRTIVNLLPEFAEALDPQFQASRRRDASFAEILLQQPRRTVSALLEVIDRRAQMSDKKPLKSIYSRLRGNAQTEADAALPNLAAILERHLSGA